MTKVGNILFTNLPVILAPMEGVTSFAFRELCKQYGADMMFTEFVSSEALIRGVEKSFQKIEIHASQRPMGIQIFGNKADSMKVAAQLAEQCNPDSIDLNFGCPVKKLVTKGCGAALLNDLPLMESIIKEVVKNSKLPVTVKTRLGWDEKSKNIVDVAERLQDCGIAAITIHGRTRAQMYLGNADWSLIGAVKNNPRMKIPVIGNGDITNPQIAKQRIDETGIDGIMIGRASIGNPWIFKQVKDLLFNDAESSSPTLNERAEVCLNHLQMAVKDKGERYGIIELRRHYAHYFKGITNFKPVKLQLLTFTKVNEIIGVLKKITENYY